MEFKQARVQGFYRGARDESEDDRIMRDLKRNWSRMPELRAQYGNSFRRYLVAIKQNVTFC